jgi:serine/threonine-protein kinase HipA
MATTSWGNVYLYDRFVGVLSEEPGHIYKFAYDQSFVENPIHEISQTLPIRNEPFYSSGILHPYFDNLIAEGWLANAQARVLGVKPTDRLSLLLGFGHDCIGAVRIEDPEELKLTMPIQDKEHIAALTSRASLSGVQPKVFLVKEDKKIRVAQYGERSTHIGKLELGMIPNLVDIEYLSLKMMAFLLPSEAVAEGVISIIPEIDNIRTLIIKRFDRNENGQPIHFEEFNQLLSKASTDKYEGSYHLMAEYLLSNPKCSFVDSERLFRRVVVNLIIGNTDAHLKNFGMLYDNNRLSLCPSYDVVASSFYPQYQSIALDIGPTSDLSMHKLKYKHLNSMVSFFSLNTKILDFILEEIGHNFEKVIGKIEKEDIVNEKLRTEFVTYLRKKWNNIKNSVGKN